MSRLWLIVLIVVAVLLGGVAVVAFIRNLNERKSRAKGKGISLLVPFRSDGAVRTQAWEWLHRYWSYWLPDAQIIMGENDSTPFCKTAAVNSAFSQATGDIIVVLDADCLLDWKIMLDCATRIRSARARHRKMWFIPYRHFYRLTREASLLVLSSPPDDPYQFSSPPPHHDTEESSGQSVGHWFGALIQIMPREAFIAAGGMDERFNGWGGEDVSFMIAVDTTYAKHRTTRNQVLHLWHPHIGSLHVDRMWVGQSSPGGNNKLTTRYQGARGRRDRMRALTREPGAGDPPR